MSIQTWYVSGYHKVLPQEEARENKGIHLYAARREWEGCQLVLKADRDTAVRVTVSAATHAGGNSLTAEVFEVLYLEAGSHGTWPDPLRPFEGEWELKAGVARSLYLRLHTHEDTVPGEYTGEVTVECGDERQSSAYTLTVWDFELPATPSCQTAFGLRRDSLEDYYQLGRDSQEGQAMYARYYDELLEHKISAYSLPVDILSDEADRYMDDPRVTSFTVPLTDTDEQLNRYFAKLRSKREWFAKAYFYALDEPSSRATYDRMEEISNRLSRLEPNFRQVIPFYMNPQFDIRLSAVESMIGKVRVWCPESCAWDDLNGCDKIGRGPDNTLGPKMAARQAAGDTVWWYVCCGPRAPYCNLHIPMAGICHRLLFWQQMQRRVEGLLYWSTDWWQASNGTIDPWTDMATVKDIDPDLFGDGSLFYPGPEGPLPSLRLECIRDGIEDFEYLTLAARHLGWETMDAFIGEVTTSLTEYETNEDVFDRVRVRLGEELEKALA